MAFLLAVVASPLFSGVINIKSACYKYVHNKNNKANLGVNQATESYRSLVRD